MGFLTGSSRFLGKHLPPNQDSPANGEFINPSPAEAAQALLCPDRAEFSSCFWARRNAAQQDEFHLDFHISNEFSKEKVPIYFILFFLVKYLNLRAFESALCAFHHFILVMVKVMNSPPETQHFSS